MPWHKGRAWQVHVCSGREELIERLRHGSWCLCQARRLGHYVLANDSTSEDSVVEYAVLKQMPDGSWRDLESWTVDWMISYGRRSPDHLPGETLERHIDELLSGKLDDTDIAQPMKKPPVIQSAQDHGRCPLCA